MPKVIGFGLVILLLISILFNIKLLGNQREPEKLYKVESVVDGDTFKISGGRRVRLLGVNAPESGRCFSEEAKANLQDLVLQKNVSLQNQFSDPYGRTIANVFVNGEYINSKMIAGGFARPDYSTNPRRDELSGAYRKSREGKLGINSGQCVSMTPSDKRCVIKGNVDDDTQKKRYYSPNCIYYKQVQIDLSSSDQWFCTESEAMKAGFVKAPKCL